MAASPPSSDEERLKAALWHSVGKIVDAIAVEQSPRVNAAPTFIAGMAEMLSTRITAISADLETFSRHAGRSVINESDAMLLARHHDGLKSVLRDKKNEGTKERKVVKDV
ncbi:hypothetical protein CERZMDRAFT_47542 [Cercospora zeae-maydis SCOH1-5]|uniref:Centromere protein S n=1 Tax=Cercospora zeae-maydis SCOH1-5 TaxID=717836 RepID=A0A6A6F668_9PEZI|nr:hypothetical protein CERZMDRAFT_47542 [Cercospora zeae-maydis SCOH1-5]